MYYEAEPLQPLGTCKALYAFDGKTMADHLVTVSIIFSTHCCSYERGKHSNGGERGAAGYRIGPGWRVDACPAGERAEWLGGGIRADQLHWEYSVCVKSWRCERNVRESERLIRIDIFGMEDMQLGKMKRAKNKYNLLFWGVVFRGS